MTARSPSPSTAQRSPATSLKTALIDAYQGFLDVSHNGMALLGTAIVVAVVTLVARADLRTDAEQQLLGWLLQRQDVAVMAIESRFNPYAQSPVGAQGLMQVLTRVHTDKYDNFGGHMAAFDPVSNLRVGVKVLQDCIKQAGSVQGGLRLYVGAVTSDGGDYINKVMAEHLRIQSVALGKPMPTSVPVYTAAPAAVPVEPGPELPTQTGLLEPEVTPLGTPSPAAPPATDSALSTS